MPRSIFAGLLIVAAAVPTGALAHALLVSAQPPVGGTVAAPPKEVAIRFTEALEPLFSSIEVETEAGQRVDEGPAHLAPDDPKRFVVDLKPLPPGSYKVIWHATSVDTHKTEGSFGFTVQP